MSPKIPTIRQDQRPAFRSARFLLTSIGLASVLIYAGDRARVQALPAAQGAVSKPAPVLLELFTSEGCNTCPPADALLAELAEKPVVPSAQIIAMEEHVDYWNHDGWTDPFSSQTWTQRQSDYQSAVGRHPDGIYTPQLLVDGAHEIVGSQTNQVLQLILAAAKEPKYTVTVEPGGGLSYNVSVAPPAGATSKDNADVFLAITETGLQSNVTAGENAGKSLKHAAVLRRLDKIGSINAKNPTFSGKPTLKLNDNWKKENLRVVVFAQDKKTRHVLGAAEGPLTGK